MTHDDLPIRRDRDALANLLSDLGAKFKGSNVTCPFHEDKSPSAAIKQKDGIWRLHCYAACCQFSGDYFDVLARAQGQTPEQVLKEYRLANPGPRSAPPAPPRSAGGPPASSRSAGVSPASSVPEVPSPDPEDKPRRVFPTLEDIELNITTYFGPFSQKDPYTNPDTNTPDLIIYRVEKTDAKNGKKQFPQVVPVPGGYAYGAPTPRPLFNRTRIKSADTVLVVEGEKCVRAAAKLGIVATTNPGGARKAGIADWTPLAGKAVVLWPDNDPIDPKTGISGGRLHMEEVAEILRGLSPPVRLSLIEPADADLHEKEDIADLVAQYGAATDTARDAVLDLMADATPIGHSAGVAQRLEDKISGRHKNIPWPWTAFTRLTRCLLPGKVVIICGDPGDGKSFFLLQAAAQWHNDGHKIALFELEDDRAYHLERALVQRSQMPELWDENWLVANAPIAREIYKRHQGFLDSFGARIYDSPDQEIELLTLGKWIEERCKEGCRIVAVDPVSHAATGREPWLDAATFMFTVKRAARQYGATVVLVTHGKKGHKTSFSLEDMAGGAAFSRFSHSVFWMRAHATDKDVMIAGGDMDVPRTINRTLCLNKCRDGKGTGLNLAFKFHGGTCIFEEYGIIRVGKNKQQNNRGAEKAPKHLASISEPEPEQTGLF